MTKRKKPKSPAPRDRAAFVKSLEEYGPIELAKIWGVSKMSVHNWMRDMDIKAVRKYV